MTVVCPSCDARFRDPPPEVLKTKSLQCGKCDFEWDPVSEQEVPNVDSPSISPTMDDLVGEVEEPIKTALPVVIPHEQDAPPPIVPIYVDRAEETKVPVKRRGMIFTTVALILVALGSSTLIFKEAIVASVPQTAKYYATAGIETRNTGLQIANVITVHDVKDGISQLIVRGEIANIADNTVPVPPIQLVMRGESSTNLYEWTVAAAKNELKAGEKSRFTAVTKDYPEGAVDVEVTFARQ